MQNTTTATQTPTATAQLAAAQFEGVVPRMLKAIKFGKAIGYALMIVVLIATYPHVGLYLYDTLGVIGWVFPAMFGGGLLAFYHVAQTPGLIAKGRKAAYAVVALCGTAELAMQTAASHDLQTRALFVTAVVIGLAAKYAAANIKPDLTAIATAENSAADQVATLAPAQPTADETAAAELAAKRRASALKGAETRRAKAAAKNAPKTPRTPKAKTTPAAPKAPTMNELPEAPISPAPGGYMIGGLWIATTMDEATSSL